MKMKKKKTCYQTRLGTKYMNWKYGKQICMCASN